MPWEAGPIWNCGAYEGELHWMLHTHTMHSWPELGLTSMHQQQLIRDDTNNTKAHNLACISQASR